MYCKVHSAKGLPNFNLKVCTYVSGKQLVYWVQSINQIEIDYKLVQSKNVKI